MQVGGQRNTAAILASYATLKVMTDSDKQKNQYCVLAEFIKYIIVTRNVYNFTVQQMQLWLKDEFDFDLPEAVIKTAIKKVSGCNKQGHEYTIQQRTSIDAEFQKIKTNAENDSALLAQSFGDFASAQNSSNAVWIGELESDFLEYLLNDSSIQNGQHSELISRFILNAENNPTLGKHIQTIREGVVLYCGLCYNINEVGSINSDISFYLDTEVLFDLLGYNGEIYQRAAEDMLEQVRNANKKTNHIRMYYFREVKAEIDRFFNIAQDIVAGKKRVMFSTAMSSILNGCKDVSDVIDKQSDFYNALKNRYHIFQDDHDDEFYSAQNYQFNLESAEYDRNDDKTQEAVRFISHINVLRKGQKYTDYMKSGHLIVTETRRIQEISDKFSEKHNCGYSLPMSRITNILWFKMGYGFGMNIYPYNTSAAIKARMVLAGSIAGKISAVYEQTMAEYKANGLSEEQVMDRIKWLKEKQTTPEKIKTDNLEELLDFSADAIQRYEDACEASRLQAKEKDGIIARISQESELKDSTIEKMKIELGSKDDRIEQQEIELNAYREAEKQKEKVKKTRIRICKSLGMFVIKLFVFCGVFLLITKLIESFGMVWFEKAKLFIDIVGVVTFVFGFGGAEWKKIKELRNTEEDR